MHILFKNVRLNLDKIEIIFYAVKYESNQNFPSRFPLQSNVLFFLVEIILSS